MREKGHVCAEVLFSRLTGLARFLCEKFVYILCIVVSLVFAWTGAQLLIEAVQYGYVDERSVDVPYWALYLFYPLSFTLIAIEFGRYLIGYGSMYDAPRTPGVHVSHGVVLRRSSCLSAWSSA